MSPPSALLPRSTGRPRRTQAERRNETRSRILEAVVECIDEIGFQRTTAAEISRRSGVTWGAVQHHYGGKDGILAAVLEDSFSRFSALLADAVNKDASIEDRVDLFVDRAWQHFASPHYRSTFEILLHSVGPDDAGEGAPWQGEILTTWKRMWRRLFPDVKLTRGRSSALQHYSVSVLSGLASMQIFAGGESRFTEMELTILKQTLVREFSASNRVTRGL
jgi:AcrR family transcriptional regulator